MSAKWRRSKAWDDKNLRGPFLLPVKALLRTFSSIWFAVVVLVLVSLYGVLASVPLGLLARIPTVLMHALIYIAMLGVIAIGPVWIAERTLLRPLGRAARFASTFGLVLGLGVLSSVLWYRFAFQPMRYDAGTGTGVLLFEEFVKRYESVTVRRLPGVEMTEIEFYSWWPLVTLLLIFVVNMVVATVRRIEFTFANLGVLTVHTGIVLIALGSVHYGRHKVEGDVLLLSGPTTDDGSPAPGPPTPYFYDNIHTALWIGATNQRGERAWQIRRIRGVPRYNDYNLDVLGQGVRWSVGPNRETPTSPPDDGGRTLAIDVPGPDQADGPRDLIPDDITFRIVGYAAFADLAQTGVGRDRAPPGEQPNPMRSVRVLVSMEEQQVRSFRFLPDKPANRLIDTMGLLKTEYTRGMDEGRWESLQADMPENTQHAIVVRVPGVDGAETFQAVYPGTPGEEFAVGGTGWTLRVEDLHERPPFPIITEGYRGAESSVAVVKLESPEGVRSSRWVYHRFPEISQEMLEDPPEGTPARRDPDERIDVWYVDGSRIQVYFDEDPSTGDVRALVRLPGLGATVYPEVGDEGIEVIPSVRMQLGRRWAHWASVGVPAVVPASERRNDMIGTHQRALIAVEVSRAGRAVQTLWIPFAKYLEQIGLGEASLARRVTLDDGTTFELVFGREQHVLPGMRISLLDFEMTPYPNSTTPRDYESRLLVERLKPGRGGELELEQLEASTSLNDPLLVRVPFVGRDDVPGFVNAIGWVFDRAVPTRYKFSQAGWDKGGWEETSKMTQNGLMQRPVASFTILGVGNNPGINIIAIGGVLMGLGIPWAFYIKPMIVKSKSRRLRERAMAKQNAGTNNNGSAVHADSTPAPARAAVTKPWEVRA